MSKNVSGPKSRASFVDSEIEFRGSYNKTTFDTLRQSYKPYLTWISLLIGLGFVGRFLLLMNANIIGFWVDSFCRPPDICRPAPQALQGLTHHNYLVLLLILTLGGFLLTLVFRRGFAVLSAKAVSQFYDEVTLRTSRLPMRFFDVTPVGRIVTRFSSDYGNIFRLFGGPLAEFLVIIFDLVSVLILMSVASLYYLPIAVTIGVLNYIIYRFNRESLRQERRALSSSRSPSIAHFAETTQGATVIRTFARESSFQQRFSLLNSQFLNQKLKTTRRIMLFSTQMTLTTALLLFLTGLAGYYLVQSGRTSIGSIGVAFAFIVLSSGSVQMFFEWLAQFEEAMTGVERLDHYLRLPIEPGAVLPKQAIYETGHKKRAATEKDHPSAAIVGATSVDVKDLWFRYSEDLPFVLKGLNFSVRPGERLGLIGRTGSGKTSLIQVLFYLYPFSKGEILLSGSKPKTDHSPDGTLDLESYRRSIALISQDPTLFRGTLRENLSLDQPFTDAEMVSVLSTVGLSEWLTMQPHGLDSKIEERGRNLSAGERQLLCMARCLLQKAALVILDEATSNVDPQSEEIMVRATREFFKDRTQIIIAHRLTTLTHCDRILWLQKGEVKMIDRPEVVLPIFAQSELQI